MQPSLSSDPLRPGQPRLKGASAPAAHLYTSSALGGFSSSNKIDSAAGQVADLRPGKTLWLILQTGVASTASTTENVLGSNTGNLSKGWWLTRAGADLGADAGRFYLLAGGGNFAALAFPPTNGIALICFVWKASNNHVLVSINGGALVDFGACACTPADSSCKTYVGSVNASFGGLPLTTARVLAFATWSTEASATDAATYGFTQGNRYVLPSGVTQSAVVDFNAARDFTASSILTHGSSPVTLTVTGSPTLTTVSEKRYVLSNANYADSKIATAAMASEYRYTIRNPYARAKLTTSALSIGVEAISTLASTIPNEGGVGLYVGGSYVSETLLSQASKPQILELQLGSGAGKSVEVWEGPQAFGGTFTDPRLGIFVQAIRVPQVLVDGSSSTASALTAPATQSKRLALLTDSIGVGFYVDNFAQHSPTALLRADYPGGVTCHGAGNESVHNLAHDDATAAATAARVASVFAGATEKDLVVTLGTNDYGLHGTAIATFTAEVGRLLDAIHAADAGILVWWVTPIQRISPASESANGAGATLGDYRTAITSAGNARSGYVEVVDGAAGAIVSNGNMDTDDGIHIRAAGAAQLKAAIKMTVGY